MSAHFDAIADAYHHEAAGAQQAVYDDIAAWISPLIAGKTVLEVGNGGKFAYDTALPSTLMALDVSEKMLAKISDPRVLRVVGDALEMQAVEDHTIDIVVLSLVLHHIVGRTRHESIALLHRVLASARRVVRPGGYVLVTESVATPPLSIFQRIAYPLTHAFLAPRVGMVYFFSATELKAAFQAVFGTITLETRLHPITGWIDPLPGTFPGRIKIPAWAFPTRFRSYLAHL